MLEREIYIGRRGSKNTELACMIRSSSSSFISNWDTKSVSVGLTTHLTTIAVIFLRRLIEEIKDFVVSCRSQKVFKRMVQKSNNLSKIKGFHHRLEASAHAFHVGQRVTGQLSRFC